MKTEDIKVYLDVNKIPYNYFASDPTKLVGDQPVEITILRYELVPNVGALTYVKNASFPRKGIPATEIVYAINIVKAFIVESIKYPIIFLFPKVRLINSFNRLFDKVMHPYNVNHLYLCHMARMMWYGTSTFLQELGIPQGLANNCGYRVAHIFEFDDAYRYRVQDMATECYLEELQDNPRKEIKRLMALWKARDQKGVTIKMNLLVLPILLLIYIPKYKRAIIKASYYFKEMKFDKADWYWTAFKPVYDYGGFSNEERRKTMQIPEMFTFN